jgi:voltage-gated potassium channel
MTGFFNNLYRLVVAVGSGLQEDSDLRGLMVLLLFSLLIGAGAFCLSVEGWSLVDILYFCVMTMSTIGYGDLVPTS